MIEQRLTRPTWAILPLLAAAWMSIGCDGSKQAYQNPQPDKSQQVNPDRPPTAKTLYAMAGILAAEGKEPEARFILEKCTRDYPKFVPAYVRLAELHMQRHQTEVARTVLLKGLQQCPTEGALLNDLGMTYVAERNYQDAARYFEQAVATCPNEPRFRTNQALAVGMLGNYDQSMALYCKVLGPEDAHYNLAVIAEARQDRARAAKEFAAAQRPPTTQEAQPLPMSRPVR